MRLIETNDKSTNDGNNRPTQQLNGRRILYRANFPAQLRNNICNDYQLLNASESASANILHSWSLFSLIFMYLSLKNYF